MIFFIGQSAAFFIKYKLLGLIKLSCKPKHKLITFQNIQYKHDKEGEYNAYKRKQNGRYAY